MGSLVKIMAYFYGQAGRTIVWLGESADEKIERMKESALQQVGDLSLHCPASYAVSGW
jgi:hypothetical protein